VFPANGVDPDFQANGVLATRQAQWSELSDPYREAISRSHCSELSEETQSRKRIRNDSGQECLNNMIDFDKNTKRHIRSVVRKTRLPSIITVGGCAFRVTAAPNVEHIYRQNHCFSVTECFCRLLKYISFWDSYILGYIPTQHCFRYSSSYNDSVNSSNALHY